MNPEKPKIAAALAKWFVLGFAGIGFFGAAFACYFFRYYTWVLVAVFAGCFLVITAGKRLWLLRASLRAVQEGRGEIVIFYRDGNQKESQQPVVPVGGDSLFFYGFSRERNDTHPFRWNRIRRASDNGKDLTKDDLLSRIGK
jgi:hypothetical protein